MTYDDDFDSDIGNDDLGDHDEWIDDDGDPADDVLVCPSCRRLVHEDTQQCPHCGDWITPVYPRSSWRRGIWVVAAVAVIFALLLMALR